LKTCAEDYFFEQTIGHQVSQLLRVHSLI